MRNPVIASLVALVASTALAGGFGLKPGLWETHVVKQVVDGRDVSAQIAGAASQLQQAMAAVPPEQRARLEAMLKQHGGPAIGSDGAVRICISPEMASRDKPIVDGEGRCQPATVNRSGNHTTFEFSCSWKGVESTGKGDSMVIGDMIRTQLDVKTHNASGETHVTHSETEMKFVAPDCGGVKPLPLPDASR